MYCIYTFRTDDERPVFQGQLSDRIVSTDPGSASAVVTWNSVIATDNSGSVTLTSNFQSGETFSVGNTDVVFTAYDPSGNSATATFTLTVEGDLFHIASRVS